MNGGKDCEGGDREGQPPLAQVPIGWQRRADRTGVVYISPSGSLLSCLDQVKSYLLTDGTCKCGLECPLILPKVFNFDPGAAVKQRTAEDVKADEDVTKLCIHKRKIIAVATLNRSMESPHPSLVLTSPGGGTSATPLVPTRSVTPRAIRNKSHEGQPNSTAPDCKNPFRMIMAGQRHYQPEQEMFAGHARVRLGSGEQGQRSPYRGGMLSPASYGDGSISPRTDPLGSPDVFARGMSGGFHGTGSPSPLNGNVRTALSSPPGLSHQGSPAAQSSCALAGRTNVPLSPTVAAKSPIMKKPACSGFPPSIELLRGIYHHQPPPPSCALQKQQITSEKDPLGILDPIPSKPGGQNPVTALNPSFQPSVHSQVPAMNVNMPPAIVPLPSNLPLPTVKPGHASHSNHAGHTQRVQHMASTSVSPSPVTSPVHMMGPAMGRLEASPQRSRPSSTSSDHGNFSMLPTPQSSCGGVKVTPRSPRPSMPPSPSTKPDGLHQYKDMLSQLPSGMNSTLSGPGGAMFPPQKNHTGMLGLPLNHILNQHNSSSFPASSLLSAAAKAQLASQGKLTGSGNSGGGVGGGGGSGGGVGVGGSSLACGNSVHPSSVGNQEGHGVSNTGFSPNPSMPLGMSEVQSGRAALRDKLMAQQRDLLRKRKQPDRGGHDDVGFNMLKSPMGGARLPGPAEQMRKAHVRPGGLPPNTSMAQLLQSMSYQSSQSAGNSAPICQGTNQSLGTSNQLHFREGAMPPGPPHHNMQALQRLPARGEDLHCQNMDTGLTLRGSHEQFTGLMDQVRAASVGACGAPGQGGQVALGNCSLGRREPHPQQVIHRHHHPPQGHPRALGPVAAATMVPNANGGSCPQNVSKKGDGLNCSLRNPQLANLRALAGNKQTFPQRPPQAVQVRQGVPGFQTPHPFPHNSSSSPMACLFHNFQVSLPESVSVSNTQTCAQSGTTPLPETSGRKSLPQFGEGPHKAQAQSVGPAGAEGLPGGCVGGESVDAIYRAVVDAASKGVQVVITTTVSGTTQARPVPSLSSMSAFTASQGGPCGLPQSVSSVIHGHRKPRLQEADARPIQPRMSCPRQSSEQGKSTHDSGKARGYFRSPGAQKRQWEGDATPGADCYPLSWRGEEFLECSAHVRSSPCKEGLRGLASSLPRPSEHQHNPLLPGDKVFLEDGFRFGNCQRVAGGGIKERLEQVAERCAHMNGGGPLLPGRGYVDTLGPPRHDLMSEDQSPSSSSTSLEGSLSKDYAHYNGHYNGCAPSPSDTKSLSSEEDLRHPDSPSSSELLHFRPRAFPMGELVWGPIKRFSPWHSKMAGEEQVHHPSLQNSEHGKVDPGRLKTLTEDLEAFNRAAKRNIKGGNLNNHLEAAIHVTMSELDKMSGNVHQVPPRDRQVKPPKSKRRKISR